MATFQELLKSAPQIGLGYFYKQEYNKAKRTFEFVINEYDYNEDIKYEATLWLASTFNQLEKYT